MLAAPLQTAGTLFGALCVTREETFGEEDVHLMGALGVHIVTALERAAQLAELQQSRTRALLALATLLETRGLETPGHARRLQRRAGQAADLLNLSPQDRAALLDGAALHDLGLLGLEDGEPQTAHAVAGETLARDLPGVTGAALRVIRHHHERWDGRGGPDGLVGHRIPLLARVLTILDTFDTLTRPPAPNPGAARTPSPALTPAQALTAMAAQAGEALDPDLLATLAPLLARLPVPDPDDPDSPDADHPDRRPAERSDPDPDGLNLN